MSVQKIIIAAFFTFMCSAQSFAATPVAAPKPKPSTPKPSPAGKNTLHINPQSLQSLLLAQNNTLEQGMNAVYQAKENVTLARTELLPSLNIGAAINGGGFLLSAVSFLLPFLMPSNWFNLRDDQQLLNSETSAYYILELNQYASAYAVYLTVVSDQDLRADLEQQYKNLLSIQNNIELGVKLGVRPQTDLDSAKAQTELMANQVAQTDELLVKETASVRQMLSLPLTTTIVFDSYHLAPVKGETTPANTLLPGALAKAPEAQQLNYMILAAQADRWSKVFGFFNGSTLDAAAGGGAGANLGHLTQGNSFDFGFSYFPTVTLSNLNIQDLQLQQQAVSLNEAQILETTIGSIATAKSSLSDAQQSEADYQKEYQAYLTEYNVGTTDLLHVLQAANSLESATVARINAQADLDNQRITLNRTLLSENFAKIEGCSVTQLTGGLLHKAAPVTLDQACKKVPANQLPTAPQAPNTPAAPPADPNNIPATPPVHYEH